MRALWMVVAGPLVLVALAIGCTPAVPEEEKAVSGIWLVDFGNEEGVLEVRHGIVYAYCYGGQRIGIFAVTGNRIDMHVRFKSNDEPQDFSGTVLPNAQGGFTVALESFPDKELDYRPFEGACD